MLKGPSQGHRWKIDLDIPLVEAFVVCVMVLAACLVGIHSRFLFSLASIWPANALLLGWLLVRPRANRLLVWIGAIIGYGLGDLYAGSSLLSIVLLNGANLVGIAAGFTLARWRGVTPLRLGSPEDVVMTIVVVAVASVTTAVAGGLSGPILFGMPAGSAFGIWLAAEFVNYALYLPLVLAAASGSLRFLSRSSQQRLHQYGALACLSVLILSMSGIGGPGAPTYVVPGLLWCAIVFRPFASAILTAATCTWILIAVPLGYFRLPYELVTPAEVTSFRLSIGMMAMGAFAVSAISSAWRGMNTELRHLAAHDPLTGVLNRGAFLTRLNQQVSGRNGAFGLLMLDVDHFKAINDSFGHAAGDNALRTLAEVMRQALPQQAIIGRLGGEEFAAILARPDDAANLATAEALRSAIAATAILTPDGVAIHATVSIGVGMGTSGCNQTELLAVTDAALYAAKHGGRNLVVSAAPCTHRPTEAPKTNPSAPRRRNVIRRTM
ncbi:putative diguanylate cyclase YcdT [Devosia equisanguinis]|uniref:diguanylate cyclase n=1 Tax=Devosia equisanguinis TaxID=2490941 RepID=A0A447IE29_9HYPH|nr:GGDEF domain-containing protein [Devosia equisanguinis]VDS05740.1 putative diguanylate cyclase YcdT [Devosia equisanguinis]